MLYFTHVQQNRILKMSCYQLSDKHHASIAHFVKSSLGWSEKQTQQLADKLKRCNLQSVNYSCNEKKSMDKCKTETYKPLDAQSYHGAVRCWGYNSGNDPKTPDFNSVLTFLFSLVPDEASIEKPINHWVID